MKKVSYIFGIISGISIMGMWSMLLISGKVPELDSEPYRIAGHLISELITALLLILSGILSIRGKENGKKLHFVSLGMLLYSVINAGGYYVQYGDIAMTILFLSLTIITCILLITSIYTRRIKM